MSKVLATVHHRVVELLSRGRNRPHRLRVVTPAPPLARPATGGDPGVAPDLTAADLVRLGEARAAARRDRRRAGAGLVALALFVAVVVAVGREAGRDTRVTSAGPGATRTAPPASTAFAAPAVPTTTGAPAETVPTAPPSLATTVAAPAASSPETTAAAPTTVPADTAGAAPPAAACRNSSDRACGPFRFEPQPGPNRPMTAEVTSEPASPRVGDEVVFRVTLTDPDGVDYNAWSVDFGDGGALGASGTATCDKFGPWDPPSPVPGAAVQVRELRHVYAAPGIHTFRFSFEAGPFDCTDAVTGAGDRPYASSARGELAVVVAP